jgi:peptide/nickel transport system substrate-binding protein
MSEFTKAKLESLLKTGKISRRKFLTGLSALGIAAAASPLFPASSAKAAGPEKGGKFVMALAEGLTSDSLDPATFMTESIANINWQLRNNLVEIDHNLNPIPELAESWEPSPDAKKWTFKLRKGVEFHNGKTFEAQDVLDSINHHRGKDSKSAAAALLKSIIDIKADGKNVVVFSLKEGNADFPYILGDYHLSILPAGTEGGDFTKGIGTGGYILENYEPGVRAFVKRNPNYWKEDRAHFDEIESLCINDTNARSVALSTGKIHWIHRADMKTAHLLEKNPKIKLIKVTGTFHYVMAMLTDVAPYDNIDVRLALKHAIDRENILKTVFHGFGKVGNDHPIAPIQRYYANELPQREYDPDKARYHIKKAGMEGHTFKFYTSDEFGFIDAAVLYKEHAAKAGIDIQVVKKPIDGYWSNVWLKEPFCSSYSSGRPTEDWMFTLVYSANASWNETRYSNKHFNQLLIEARAELDETKRREKYVEMQRLCRDDGGAIIHTFKDYVEACDLNVQYGNIAGNWSADGCRNAERWWFKSV